MKGILLALISFSFFVAVSFFSLRAYRGKKYFHVFLAEFPLVVFLYFFLFHFLPNDLYFLPERFLEPSPLADAGNGFFIVVLLFHIFWDATYAAILTGFASELLVRLFRQKVRGLSLEELIEGFGGKKEIDHVLAWRLPNLVGGKYIQAEGNHFRLLPKGRRVATFALFLKRLFNMEEGG